ncbi:carboxylesterase/lipase family protein [Mycobacterium camsae]|uniref:carboxylesterase/lipase family protein n=1 Tax=Mycobacterium gordonae TaxID=1778 RepID=UPI0019821607|nr:carboxylesterase/lipase family protein [Mycobacterium gordonae]
MHEPTVRAETVTGVLEGFTRNGVHRWRSIPYARPPLGPLRFQEPQPAPPWQGVRRCYEFSNCAPQHRRYAMIGISKYQPSGEDCLTLNVVAPEAPRSGSLPVMVFVHGGAYMMGSSALPLYDGAALARRDCVYVSVNYRLGALGCLDLSSLSTPGFAFASNLFLRDLVLALHWVRANIAAFGGDPECVTVVGVSAGAQAVTTLLTVPAARGLFRRAIAQSPPAGMARSQDAATELATQFAKLLGAGPQDAGDLLMRASPSELIGAQDALIAQCVREKRGFPLGPTYGDDYLPLDPIAAMRRGRAHQLPLVVGTNADEGRLFTRFLKLVPTTEAMVEGIFAGKDPQVHQRITAAYPDYPKTSACIRLGGDFAFSSAAWQIAEAHGSQTPTYVYRYDYAPRTLRWSGLGATHGTELFAVFDAYRSKFGRLLTVGADRRRTLHLSDEIQQRWTCFAGTGLPGTNWPTYTKDDRSVMVFDRICRCESDPHSQRRIAWDGFWDEMSGISTHIR